jgi:hypothetical protein
MTPHQIARYLLVEARSEHISADTRRSMSETLASNENKNEFGLCEIRVKGHLDERWTGRFDNTVITREPDGNTLLICQVTDQAALHGLLKKVRDLGISLISVNFINSGRAGTEEVN